MSNWDYILSASQKGWECPRCGRINAPWLPCCSCNKSTTYTTFSRTIDTTSTASTDGDLRERREE